VRAPAATDGTEPVGVVDDRDKLINYWTSNFFFFFCSCGRGGRREQQEEEE